MLVPKRVVVAAGRGERRATGTDSVDVKAVQTRRQPGDVDVDVDAARRILHEPGPADLLQDLRARWLWCRLQHSAHGIAAAVGLQTDATTSHNRARSMA
jgi:hypothetical protein